MTILVESQVAHIGKAFVKCVFSNIRGFCGVDNAVFIGNGRVALGERSNGSFALLLQFCSLSP